RLRSAPSGSPRCRSGAPRARPSRPRGREAECGRSPRSPHRRIRNGIRRVRRRPRANRYPTTMFSTTAPPHPLRCERILILLQTLLARSRILAGRALFVVVFVLVAAAAAIAAIVDLLLGGFLLGGRSAFRHDGDHELCDELAQQLHGHLVLADFLDRLAQ